MFENFFLIFIGFVWILAASIQDLRKREVANWLNFSLLTIALAYRAFYSVLTWSYLPLLFGLAGIGVMLIVANLLYYGRIFAGGDAKLLIALGAVLPLSSSILGNVLLLGSFIFLLLFLGSFYGLFYSLVLALKNHKIFWREYKRQIKKNKIMFFYCIIGAVVILLFAVYFKEIVFYVFPLLILIFPFLFAYSKSIEEGCLVYKIKTSELTLGDWLYEEVKVKGKIIKPNWEGLDERELRLLRESNKEVYVKQGIPFIPSFLLAFIALLIINKFSLFNLNI